MSHFHGRFLPGTSLRKLYLGPLLDDILDDVTVAHILGQQYNLTIDYPITLGALEILDLQCSGRPMLNQLQYLQMQCTSHAAEVLTLLLSLTPCLRLFYLALYPSPTAGFEVLSRLLYLRRRPSYVENLIIDHSCTHEDKPGDIAFLSFNSILRLFPHYWWRSFRTCVLSDRYHTLDWL